MAQVTDSILQAKEVVNNGILKRVPISGRFDFSVLAPHIVSMEDRFLIETKLISAAFYTDLKDEILNNVSSYNTALGSVVEKYDSTGTAKQIAYETLWRKFLMELLSLGVLYEALPYIQLKIGSAGVRVLEGNLSESAGVRNMKYLRDDLMEKINRLSQRMKDWLCDNKSDYSLYDVEGTKCGDCEEDSDYIGASGIVIY